MVIYMIYNLYLYIFLLFGKLELGKPKKQGKPKVLSISYFDILIEALWNVQLVKMTLYLYIFKVCNKNLHYKNLRQTQIRKAIFKFFFHTMGFQDPFIFLILTTAKLLIWSQLNVKLGRDAQNNIAFYGIFTKWKTFSF